MKSDEKTPHAPSMDRKGSDAACALLLAVRRVAQRPRRPSVHVSLCSLLALSVLGACSGPVAEEGVPSTAAPVSQERPVEATSLLGEPLPRTELPADVEAEFMEKLAAAEATLQANPDDADALIWVGRRTAYLGRYQDAIEIFSRGVEAFPDDPRFLRHRGHRYISTRQFDRAIEDLGAAYTLIQGTEDEVEPDGMPNEKGVPTSTLHSNIRYHLALAHYLQGDFEAADPLWREDVERATNSDMRTASSYWLYLTLRRLGRDGEADAVVASLPPFDELIENFDYHRLLQAFVRGGTFEDGEDGPDTLNLSGATVGYGLATFDLIEGRAEQAQAKYRQILDGSQWAAFGYIAAEAEVARSDHA